MGVGESAPEGIKAGSAHMFGLNGGGVAGEVPLVRLLVGWICVCSCGWGFSWGGGCGCGFCCWRGCLRLKRCLLIWRSRVIFSSRVCRVWGGHGCCGGGG